MRRKRPVTIATPFLALTPAIVHCLALHLIVGAAFKPQLFWCIAELVAYPSSAVGI